MNIHVLISDIEAEYASLEASLNTPEITADPKQLMILGRRKAELDMLMTPINELKDLEKNMRGNAEITQDAEADPELKNLAFEENVLLAQRKDALEKHLHHLLLPKDPNDGKDIIVEIRAGAGLVRDQDDLG